MNIKLTTQKKFLWIAGIGYFLTLIAYSVWSYGLTDPNLVYSHNSTFWQFQQWAWATFFHNRPLQTTSFVALIVLSFAGYAAIVSLFRRLGTLIATKKTLLKTCLLFVLLSSPLLFSNNALSHDVFNYIFNARMVVMYGANPHAQVALHFDYDPWTRFMHNTHTTAPYWYGWTAISLAPYILGFGKFVLTWLNFRLFSLIGLLLYAGVIWLWQQQQQKKLFVWQLLAFLLNPLVVLELVSNSHNDMWMLAPALAAFVLLWRGKDRFIWFPISLLLLLFSASTKYATLILLPLWFVSAALIQKEYLIAIIAHRQSKLVGKILSRVIESFSARILSFIWKILPLSLSCALFLPLLISRSQWFLPWYLTWSFSLLPLLLDTKRKTSSLVQLDLPLLAKVKSLMFGFKHRWILWMLALSISSLLRYVPWLSQGEYNPTVISQQIAITWLGAVLIWLGFLLVEHLWLKRARA